ncbi:hypothetical protein LQW54_010080 [Pestalotiopsis sp. IQ-011]
MLTEFLIKALTSHGDNAISDCSAKLIVTVTPAASTVTQTETVTATESTADSALFTETLTTTDATEISLFTISTTVTASTETDTISEQTTTITTTTSIYTAPPTLTTTVFNYLGAGKRGVTARQTAEPELPEYAAAACGTLDLYVSACQRIGVETSTVTLPAATETVTQFASTTAITTWSTVSSTETDVVSVTATVSSTQTDTESVTVTTLTTETATVTSTEMVLTTTTPTSVVSYSCQPTGINFRMRAPFPDATTRFANAVSNAIVTWQAFPSSPSASSLASSTWVLGAGGYLELSSNALVAYVNAPSSSASSLQVKTAAPSTVAAGVAAGTMARISGCVDRDMSSISMMTDGGRANMLSCGNAFYMSRGTGKEIRSDCVLIASLAVSA